MKTKMLLAAVFAAALAGESFAEGVIRTIKPISGGCKVTLAWEFSEKAGSDLILEEQLASGWKVATESVPFNLLDATWFSGSTARFAVKRALAAKAGSISFNVFADKSAVAGAVKGGWMIYLGGKLKDKVTDGAVALTLGGTGTGGGAVAGGGSGSVSEGEQIAITSFKLLNDGQVELAYAGVAQAGMIVIEGCEGLDLPWVELKRLSVSAGDGKVILTTGEVGGSRFIRIKLLK